MATVFKASRRQDQFGLPQAEAEAAMQSDRLVDDLAAAVGLDAALIPEVLPQVPNRHDPDSTT